MTIRAWSDDGWCAGRISCLGGRPACKECPCLCTKTTSTWVPACICMCPPCFSFLKTLPVYIGVGPVYMHILHGHFVYLCCPQKSFKFQMSQEVYRGQSLSITEEMWTLSLKMRENYLRSDQKLTDSIRDTRSSCHLFYCIDSLAEWLPLMNLKCNINEERSIGSRFWTRTNCLRELQGVHQGTIVCGKYSVSNNSMKYYFHSKWLFLVLSTQNACFKRAFSHRYCPSLFFLLHTGCFF